MQALYILLLVAACHGIPIDVPQAPLLNLPIPEFKKLITKDDPNNITSHEIVHWTEVKSDDPDDPVIGYKLKVWELKKIKTTIYKKQGDKVVRLVEEAYPKMNFNTIPDGVPKEIITPANEPMATLRDVHVDVPYQLAVLAFTANGEGPLSAPVRITLLPGKKVTNLDDWVDTKTETKYK